MFLFTKIGILMCLFFLACCLLLDIVWHFAAPLFGGVGISISFLSWWGLVLATIPLGLFSCWLAFRIFFGRWLRPG